MPEAPLRRTVGGDEIIAEILKNAAEGQFRMRRTVLLPCVFQVYLHQSDFDLIRPVIPALRKEASAALQEHLEELNRRAQPSKMARMFGLEKPDSGMTWSILDSAGFSIEFFPDLDGALEPGDLEIRSDLAAAPPPEFDGAKTRHITRRQSGPVAPEAGSATERSSDETSSTATLPVYGWIRYPDGEGGEGKVFPISKNEIAIGRGGKTVWVDVQLTAPPDVSREHCRIRRDAATGQFFVSDVSQFGTSLDGRRLPQGEVRLPPRATLALADVITLEFEQAGAK